MRASSFHYRVMMTRTHSDQLEVEVASPEATITDEVTTVVVAVAQQLTSSLEKMTSQFKEDLRSTSERLERRIDSTQDDQNLLVGQIKHD